MSIPLWGELEKAQDDPRTIAEYIDDMLQSHNEDTEAHLGENETLKSHKDEAIIDHPAGSVLADKQTMTEVVVNTAFESLDAWSISGSVLNDIFPGVALYIESGEVEYSALDSQPQIPINFRNSSFDMLFQALIRFSLSNSSFNSSFGFLQTNNIAPTGFGFIIENGELFAYAKQSTNIYKSSEIVIDLSESHVYRVFLDAFDEKIYWYIDGSKVAETTIPGIGWEDDQGPSFWLKNVSGNDGNMYVGMLNFSRQI